MDGENNGSKPYEQMDDSVVPLFLETPNCSWLSFQVDLKKWVGRHLKALVLLLLQVGLPSWCSWTLVIRNIERYMHTISLLINIEIYAFYKSTDIGSQWYQFFCFWFFGQGIQKACQTTRSSGQKGHWKMTGCKTKESISRSYMILWTMTTLSRHLWNY